MLRTAFPVDGRSVRGWLQAPIRVDRGAVVPAFDSWRECERGSLPRSGASADRRSSVSAGPLVGHLLLRRMVGELARGASSPNTRLATARRGPRPNSAARTCRANTWRTVEGPRGELALTSRIHGQVGGRDEDWARRMTPSARRRRPSDEARGRRPPERQVPDSIEGTAARPLGAALMGRARSGRAHLTASYGSSMSLVPCASDVAAVLKAFERSADAPAVFGTQK